jgi:transposase
MKGLGTDVRIYLVCDVTDMRKGNAVIAEQAQYILWQKTASGAVFAFWVHRGDQIKPLLWDGQGLCLY